MMNLIFTLMVFSVPLILSGLLVWNYAKAEGTWWDRLKFTFSNSMSIVWARLNSLSIALVGLVGDASGWLGAPGVQDVVGPWLDPKALIVYALVVTLGAEVARRRTLKTE